MNWEGLNPPYSTIVADPPWPHHRGYSAMNEREGHGPLAPKAFSEMSPSDLMDLPVASLAGPNCALWLWSTSSSLPVAFQVLQAWGFAYSQALVWSKKPMGCIPGGLFSQTVEFILLGRVGRAWWSKSVANRSAFEWDRRRGHSTKPEGFRDLVEMASPGPYVELFARQPRLGWDSWGLGYEGVA